MKVLYITIILMFLFCRSIIQAQTHQPMVFPGDSSFSMGMYASTGVTLGVVGEYVYSGKKKISYLDWDLMPMVYAGGGIEALIKKRLAIGFGFWLAVNKTAGSLEDFDWNSSSVMTNYSWHINNIIAAYFGECRITWTFSPLTSLNILAGAGYRAKYFSFMATDGYLEYPPGSNKVYLSGNGISYVQMNHIPFLLAELRYRIIKNLKFSASVAYSPCVVTDAIDTHYFRGLIFHDQIAGAQYIALHLGLHLDLSGVILNLRAAFENTFETTGSTQITDMTTGGSSATYPGMSGISYIGFTADFSIMFRFF